jgi:hypothetical protein
VSTVTLPADVGEALGRAVAVARSHRGERDLARRLYADWYAIPVAPAEAPTALPHDLAQMFRAVHAASDPWEDGWVAESVGRAGELVAVRDGERIVLERPDYVATARPGMMAHPGDDLLVPARRDHIDAEAGWWFTHSDGWRLEEMQEPLVRLYWNVGVGGVAALVRVLTAAMLHGAERWMLKCALAPQAYVRADTAVLFLPWHAIEGVRESVDRSRAALSRVLRSETPPLALRIGPGVGVADDPGTGESFGQHRCRLVAEAVSATDADGEQMMDAVLERFRSAGVPPERPYVSGDRVLPWE